MKEPKMTLTTTTLPATEKQVAYVRDLAAKRDWHVTDPCADTIVDVLGNVGNPDPKFVTRSEASAAIDALLSCRPRPVESTSSLHTGFVTLAEKIKVLAELPLVKFALPRTDGSGIDFFEVVERQNGARYLNRLLGCPGDWNREHLSVAHQVAAGHAFAKDVKAAMDLYANEFTVCSKCDAPLSNERSRTARLGQRCAEVLGYDW
jgi:translation initiation factor 2 beta subunit (eIF-2beta)/eIF-5